MAVAKAAGNDGKPRTRGTTRARAIEVAESLLRDGGYAALSLDAVAQRLGIRSPSLYHHFPQGKEGLFLSIAQRRAEIDGRTIAGLTRKAANPVAGLRSVARYFASVAGQHPYQAITASLRSLSPGLQKALQAGFATQVEAPLLALVVRARSDGTFRDCNEVFVVRAFLHIMLGIDELVTDRQGRKMLPDRLVDLFVEGLLPR